MMDEYTAFLERKMHRGCDTGFEPVWLPDFLFQFQRHLVEWAIRRGRAAIFADCGLGKTPMQLVWAENIARHTNGRVLILTPLAVGAQTIAEGQKFGVEVTRCRSGLTSDAAHVVVTNYEQLDHFDAADFRGVVCDESSILKHFSGATQKTVTRFLTKIPYRLLCTATAAPNDYIELGTSSEALGELGYTDMLARFFQQGDKARFRMDEVRLTSKARPDDKQHNYFGKLAFRIAQQFGQWRLKPHAETPFWQWVSSWARACRRPSDLGFSDDGFVLPPLIETHHIVKAIQPPTGMLFTLPAFGLAEERDERRRTLEERCQAAAQLVAHERPAIIWCQYNPEGDLLERLIPDAVQIAGRNSDEIKEERINAFLSGRARVLITKAKIAGFGLNLQHCAHVVTFVTHSYEAYYQSVRRCWRFGQTQPVQVDIIATEGESRISANMERKSDAAAMMFDRLIEQMHRAMGVTMTRTTNRLEYPTWLLPTSA